MTGSSDSNLNRGDADPFSHLHKMSTTAGLGSGDYVAINGAAVAAILLGLGSALVLFNSMVFMVIPLLGIIIAVWAFKQIADSNGTQTGREVAAIGLVLSLGFGGYYGGKTVYNTYRNRADEHQIVSNIHRLGDLIRNKDYAQAYTMFDDRFRNRYPLSQFTTVWRQVASSPIMGGVQRMDWNEVLSFDIDPVDNTPIAQGMIRIYAKPEQPFRVNMAFRCEDGNWLIDQVPLLFSPPATPAAPSTGGNSARGSAGSTFIGPPKP